jgi:hypothetical protein
MTLSMEEGSGEKLSSFHARIILKPGRKTDILDERGQETSNFFESMIFRGRVPGVVE